MRHFVFATLAVALLFTTTCSEESQQDSAFEQSCSSEKMSEVGGSTNPCRCSLRIEPED